MQHRLSFSICVHIGLLGFQLDKIFVFLHPFAYWRWRLYVISLWNIDPRTPLFSFPRVQFNDDSFLPWYGLVCVSTFYLWCYTAEQSHLCFQSRALEMLDRRVFYITYLHGPIFYFSATIPMTSLICLSFDLTLGALCSFINWIIYSVRNSEFGWRWIWSKMRNMRLYIPDAHGSRSASRRSGSLV